MKKLNKATITTEQKWDEVLTHVEYGLRMSPQKFIKHSPLKFYSEGNRNCYIDRDNQRIHENAQKDHV